MARKEKEEALDAQTGFQVREESLKLEVSNLQQQVKSLQSKREQESKQFEQEKHKWGEAVGQLHRSSDTAIQEVSGSIAATIVCVSSVKFSFLFCILDYRLRRRTSS